MNIVSKIFSILSQIKCSFKNMSLMAKFRYALLTCLAITLSLVVLSFVTTLFSQGFLYRDICFTSDCVNTFTKGFEGAFYILYNGLKLIGAATAIFGVYIALKNYLISVRSSALTGHIGYLKLFQEYLVSEISRRDKLSVQKIDIFFWYKNIFPFSEHGDMHISSSYIESIERIANAIRTTNSILTTPGPRFSYKNHQSALIKAFSEIGISLDRLPKNDFSAAESQLIELVDAVNLTFSVEVIHLSNIERAYT